MNDEDLTIIFIGDYLDGITLSENATIKTLEFIKELQKNRKMFTFYLGIMIHQSSKFSKMKS